MLSQDVQIRFYSNPKMCQLPIGIHGDVIDLFEDVLNAVKGDNPNATVSELLSATVPESISTEFAESDSEFAESTGSISSYAQPTTEY